MPYDDESAIAGLLRAYRSGVFPMADPSTGRIHWFAPDPRGVIPLQRFHVPRSLARVVRSGTFEIEADRDFEGVMRACAAPRPQEADTWIDATQAWYVIGSNKRGGMGAPEAVPFLEKSLAEGFAAEHGGQVVAFAELPEGYILGSSAQPVEELPGHTESDSHDHVSD